MTYSTLHDYTLYCCECTCDPGNYFNEPLIYARALLYSGGGGGANQLMAERVLYGCWNSCELA